MFVEKCFLDEMILNFLVVCKDKYDEIFLNNGNSYVGCCLFFGLVGILYEKMIFWSCDLDCYLFLEILLLSGSFFE